jgi:hypothetical protein
MDIIILWAILAALVGWFGHDTRLGFFFSFILAILLGPLIGFLIVLFYPSRPTDKEHAMNEFHQRLQADNHQKPEQQPLRRRSTQLEKLANLKEKNYITQQDYDRVMERQLSEL